MAWPRVEMLHLDSAVSVSLASLSDSAALQGIIWLWWRVQNSVCINMLTVQMSRHLKPKCHDISQSDCHGRIVLFGFVKNTFPGCTNRKKPSFLRHAKPPRKTLGTRKGRPSIIFRADQLHRFARIWLDVYEFTDFLAEPAATILRFDGTWKSSWLTFWWTVDYVWTFSCVDISEGWRTFKSTNSGCSIWDAVAYLAGETPWLQEYWFLRSLQG